MSEEKEVQPRRKAKVNIWLSPIITLIVALLVAWIVAAILNTVHQNRAVEKVSYLLEQTGQLSNEIKLVAGDKTEFQTVKIIDAATANDKEPVEFGEIYISTDGKKLIYGQIIDYTEALPEPSAAVEKTALPVVELFVWSYCPYGIQMQGPFNEVAALLKGAADFRIVPFHDGHGAYENQQNKIELCIQELEPEKFVQYSEKVVSEIYPACQADGTEKCDKDASIKVMNSLSIDSAKIFDCVAQRGAELFDESRAVAVQYGVTGSPTVIINGTKVDVARNAEALKTVVCEAMLTPAAACGQVLGDTTAAQVEGNC